MNFTRSSIIRGASILLLFLSLFSATAAQSINTLKEHAQKGDAEAQDNLGHAYANGEDVPHDFAQAVVWFRKAAEQGNADAQYNLGVAYDNGEGVPQDYAQAAVWFRKAAEQGNADAQFCLGVDYDNGEGVPQDYAQAAVWYRKAAYQGNADAIAALSRMNSQSDTAQLRQSQVAAPETAESAGSQSAPTSQQQWKASSSDTWLAINAPQSAPTSQQQWKTGLFSVRSTAISQTPTPQVKTKMLIISPSGEKAELNEDDNPDVCGSGGCSLSLRVRDDSGTQKSIWEGLGALQSVYVVRVVHNGHYTLRVMDKWNKEHYDCVWNGRKYESQASLNAENAEERAIANVAMHWPKAQCIRAINNFINNSGFFQSANSIHASVISHALEGLSNCGKYSWPYEDRNSLPYQIPFSKWQNTEQLALEGWLVSRINLYFTNHKLVNEFLSRLYYEHPNYGSTLSIKLTLNVQLDFLNRHGLTKDFFRDDDLQFAQLDFSKRIKVTHDTALLLGLP